MSASSVLTIPCYTMILRMSLINKQADKPSTSVSNHAAMKPKSNVLLMTCHVLVQSPGGTLVESRALLDSGSSTSFIPEHLAQTLCLPRSRQNTLISGIACLSSKTSSLYYYYTVLCTFYT